MPDRMSRRTFLTGGAALACGALPVLDLAGHAAASARPTTGRRVTTANCLTKADNGRLDGLRVFRFHGPPTDDTVDADYPYWPCTDTTSASPVIASSTWSGNKWQYMWANRGDTGWNWKPNQVNPGVRSGAGITCGPFYSSVDKANACTRSQIRYVLGRTDYADPWVAAGGSASDFVAWSELSAHPDDHFDTDYTGPDGSHWRVTTDLAWLPPLQLGDVPAPAPGITLDYEVTDDRTTSQSTTFLQAVANDIHDADKLFFLTINPPPNARNGLDATNLSGLHRTYLDFIQITILPNTTDVVTPYHSQLAALTGPAGDQPIDYSRIALFVTLGQTSPTVAATVHDLLTDPDDPHPTTVWMSGGGAVEGGACGSTTNDVVSLICFGEPS